jgi:hypothetical protein
LEKYQNVEEDADISKQKPGKRINIKTEDRKVEKN